MIIIIEHGEWDQDEKSSTRNTIHIEKWQTKCWLQCIYYRVWRVHTQITAQLFLDIGIRIRFVIKITHSLKKRWNEKKTEINWNSLNPFRSWWGRRRKNFMNSMFIRKFRSLCKRKCQIVYRFSMSKKWKTIFSKKIDFIGMTNLLFGWCNRFLSRTFFSTFNYFQLIKRTVGENLQSIKYTKWVLHRRRCQWTKWFGTTNEA